MTLSIWALMIVGEWYVACLALRKIRKTYPWFTALLCAMALKSIVLFYIRTTDEANYFYPYYRSEFAVSFLQLGATVEVFGTLFRPFWTVPKNSLVTLGLALTTTLCVATKANIAFADGGEIAFYHTMDRVVSCSLAITLAAALLFARHFQMPFRSRLKGIAAGLFVMSVTSVLTTLVTASLNGSIRNPVALVPVVAHYSTLSLWIYHVERRETLVAIMGQNELEEVRTLFNQFKYALSYAPTPCGLTLRKEMGKAESEEKAKLVNHG